MKQGIMLFLRKRFADRHFVVSFVQAMFFPAKRKNLMALGNLFIFNLSYPPAACCQSKDPKGLCPCGLCF